MGGRPDPDRPSRDQISSWIDEFMQGLPVASRRKLGLAFPSVDAVLDALEAARREGDPDARNPKAFVEAHMAAFAFRELLDPDDPLDDPWVLKQSTLLCREVLDARNWKYRSRYGDLIDFAAAEAIGWLSLSELAERLWRGKEIENPRAYLRRIIEGDVQKLIKATLRQAYPGDAAREAGIKRHDKRLRQEQPDLDKVTRRALAVKAWEEELKRGLRNLLDRVDVEDLDGVADDAAEVPELANSAALIAAIERLVEDPQRFTDVDRDTWVRWKAADFRGADIEWPEGCSRRAGSQRLQALCKKLRRLLGDDWL